MDADVFDAFKSMGASDDRASAAAQALSRRDPDMAILKADAVELKSDVATLKTDVSILKTDVSILKVDVSVLRTDVNALKVDMAVGKWMLGFIAAGMAALLLKAFVH